MERVRVRERESERGREAAVSNDGGWIPVLRKHRNQVSTKAGTNGIVTLFVDNIPDYGDQIWLQRTFNKFGVVKDAFIPKKRSKRTGNKFGFVRYECPVSAGVAVSRMNGVWVENERLFVKEASFGYSENKPKMKVPSFQVGQELRDKDKGMVSHILETGEFRGKGKVQQIGALRSHDCTFVQALKGEPSKRVADQRITLRIDSCGNGWLFRSVVAVMHRVVSMSTLKASFSRESEALAQFRSLGGREVLVTFQSQDSRDILIRHPWMKLWFESVKPWKGDPASFERFIWLSCRGVPLSGWSAKTFKQIEESWGYFIKMDKATLRDESFAKGRVLIASKEAQPIDKWIHLRVEGVVYEVHVSEESSFVSPDGVEDLDPSVVLCQEKLTKEAAMEFGSNAGQGDEDDVAKYPAAATNRNGVVGAGWDSLVGGAAMHGKDKVGAECRDHKHVNADKHLMLEKTGSLALLGDFESRVGDSVEGELGSLAQPIAQKGKTDLPSRDGPIGLSIEPSTGGFGAQVSHISESLISPVLVQHDDSASFHSGDDTQMVRVSQIPSINLMVDLNDADCRRRRRRQLSNLLSLREATDPTPAENDPSSPDDSIQSDSAVSREVRATMAIGGMLGVNFLPKDDMLLNTMIEIEAKEYSLALEREAEG
ncbi:hypothetical protein RHGRI_034421 [Rhododendron griersonianum]|uniref:RRM domain-containing protein n=1 Tax=Rhododendron griersonianum TaxID=479676 RepID=A0AAV6I1A7_9ERIC|nr:hypothetical protein RHGRI_034421 [Rhododendron griersonianum]